MIRKGTRSKKLIMVAGLMAALVGILLISSACATVTAQDIKGILQAMDGKEVTIKLDDGSTVRVSVSPAQASSETQSLVGQTVTAEVRTDSDGRRHLVSLRQEDHGTFTGVLQSIATGEIVVEGKTFKVTASTTLEPGLATGMTVRVKFTTQADGSTLATDVESKHPDQGVRAAQDEDGDNEGEDQDVDSHKEDADEDEDEFTGVITAVSTVSITVGDRTFKLTSSTEKEGNIVVGATVEVEFATLLADGSLIAEEIDVIKPPQP